MPWPTETAAPGACARGVQCFIPEREDQKSKWKRKGSAGARPVTYGKEMYKHRDVVEFSFNAMSQWRSLAHPRAACSR